MSRYQWTEILFVNRERKAWAAPGIVIGNYTVGPVHIEGNIYSAAVWNVSCVRYGVMIAEYTDLQVAVNFAHYLERVYGDISGLFERRVANTNTDGDKEIFDRLRERRKHSAFHDCNTVEYIPFDPNDY